MCACASSRSRYEAVARAASLDHRYGRKSDHCPSLRRSCVRIGGCQREAAGLVAGFAAPCDGGFRCTNAQELYGLVAAGSGDSLDAQAQNFVRVLIENDRLSLLPEISALFESLKNEREGVVEATIDSAFPLDDAALSQLVADLERRFKRKVRPQVNVDRDLIGGALIKVGDEVIDGSVRGRLQSMASALRT